MRSHPSDATVVVRDKSHAKLVTVAPPLGRGQVTESYVARLRTLGVPAAEIAAIKAKAKASR